MVQLMLSQTSLLTSTVQCPTNVLTVHYMFTDIISLGLVHLVCATVLKTIKHATDSRQQRVMVQQVCNATSYHYHDGVGQASGMAQTIIRNTKSTVKCIYPHILNFVHGAIIGNITSLDTAHCKMYSRPNIELGVCKVCRDADELTFLPPAVMSQCDVIQLYVIQLYELTCLPP